MGKRKHSEEATSFPPAETGDVPTEGAAAPAEQPPKPAESKEARFRRLASYRTVKAIKAIRTLKPLSNRSAYAFTEEQIDKITAALTAEIRAVSNAFDGSAKPADALFEV